MDKLRRVLSGDEPTPEEESSIITQVKKFSNGTDLIRSLNIFWLEELWLWRGLGASRWQRPRSHGAPSRVTQRLSKYLVNINQLHTQINDMSTLSWSTRIKGFVICFALGILLSLLGSVALFLHRGIVVFAVFYTLGNVISMARWASCWFRSTRTSHKPANESLFSGFSTCFLMGPFKQIKKMFAETRLIATIIVLVMMVLTFIAAIVVRRPCSNRRYHNYLGFGR